MTRWEAKLEGRMAALTAGLPHQVPLTIRGLLLSQVEAKVRTSVRVFGRYGYKLVSQSRTNTRAFVPSATVVFERLP